MENERIISSVVNKTHAAMTSALMQPETAAIARRRTPRPPPHHRRQLRAAAQRFLRVIKAAGAKGARPTTAEMAAYD
jgi:hypothetical protein